MLLLNLALLITLFLTSFSCEEESQSRKASSSFRDFVSVEKREIDQGYFNQCRLINLPKEHLGCVNVFTFLDASWHYSYRQAIMLRLLKKRLKRNGFADIRFSVVIAPPDLPEDRAGNAREIEAWMGISMVDSQGFLRSQDVPPSDLSENSDTDITFIQDTPELGIWEKFRASKNEIIVLDRCGKLTYQLIVPLSILYFPYVKAAVLSTYNVDPCGPCDIQFCARRKSVDYEDQVHKKMEARQGNEKQDVTDTRESKISLIDKSEDIRQAENTTTHGNNANTPALIKCNENSDILPSRNKISESSPCEYDEIDKMGRSSIKMNVSSADTRIKDNTKSGTSDDSNSSQITSSTGVEEENTHGPVLVAKKISENSEILKNATSLDDSNLNKGAEKTDNLLIQRNRGSLPLRIIMRAPHVHPGDVRFKKHKYLILKTGNPDYHDHLDPEKNSAILRNRTAEVLPCKTSPEMREHGNLSEYVYDKDESPGLYGEVADYWKNDDEDYYTIKNETMDGSVDYDDATDMDHGNMHNEFGNEEDASKSDQGQLVVKFNTESDDSTKSINEMVNFEEVGLPTDADTASESNKEEEFERKLVEHYNKLLPWIYYVLNK